MANINTFLLRDIIGDDGVQDHSTYSQSPDLICYKQVADPATFFTQNYNNNVSQAVDTNSKTNAMYVRGKNLNQSALSGRVQVYRSSMSLFMTPSIWKNNILYTAISHGEEPKSYTEFSAASKSVAVCKTPLVIDGTYGSNFCLVGMASDTAGPVIPADFRTYDDFVKWITTNQGVCLKNHSISRQSEKNSLEFAARILNPESREVLGAFVVEIKNAVRGAVYGIKNEALGINAQHTVNSDDGSDRFTLSTFVAANVDAFVTAFANGTSLPTDATLTVSFHYGSLPDSPVYHLAKPAASLLSANDSPVFSKLFNSSRNIFRAESSSNYKLILLGRCSVTSELIRK